MPKLDINKVVERVQASVGLLHANISDAKRVGEDLHKVVVTFNSKIGSPYDRARAIARLFDNKVSVVENSFREIANAYKYTAVGFVQVNRESIPYTEEVASSGRYSVIANNVLLDEEDDSLWELSATSDNSAKFLVRNGREDLSSLVALAKVSNPSPHYQHASVDSIFTDVSKSSYVAYVDENTFEVKHGYVLASYDAQNGDENLHLEVLDRESLQPVKVNPELLVEGADLNGDDLDNLPKTETAAEYDLTDKASLSAYYSKLYSYAPAYYNELEKIIKSQAAA